MNGPKEVTAQFAAISETISMPAMPTGTTSGNLETSYTYIASGASSNLGHSLEYQFDWKGDGTDLSLWGAANQQEVWTIAGTYNVRVRARCSTHTPVVSNWSSSLQVTIQGAYQISCSDTGIQCLERTDGGSDGNNLVNGKPKVDVEYDFQITVQDAGGTPQYVKLFTTQRNNPAAGDFYDYDMTCSGNYPTGASCTHRTMLGPAAVHKFYFRLRCRMDRKLPTQAVGTSPDRKYNFSMETTSWGSRGTSPAPNSTAKELSALPEFIDGMLSKTVIPR